jgi:CII-binding regulator of phage lambda lysogenization HflD
MLKYIIAGDEDKLTKSFESLLYNIPSVLHQKIEDINEVYYHLLFSSWLQILGFDVTGGDRTLGGDSGSVLRIDNSVVIIEYKYSETLSIEYMLNDGMDQIKKKGYHKAYQNKNFIFVSVATKQDK